LKRLLLLLLVLGYILIGCGGRKADPGWTAEEYYRYAKEKYDDEDYLGAQMDFDVVVLRYGGSIFADSAQYFLAMCHFYMDEFLISAVEFRKLITDRSQSPLVVDAQFMLAESYYEMSPRPSLDQEYTLKALKEYQIFLEDYPYEKRKEEVEKKVFDLRNKLARKNLQNAELYRKMGKLKSSLIYYDIVLESYYDSEWADDALYGKAIVYLNLDDYAQAKEELLTFKNRFPDSEILEKVDRKLLDLLAKENN
jgi:outer membrane protein assembly factor BamD